MKYYRIPWRRRISIITSICLILFLKCSNGAKHVRKKRQQSLHDDDSLASSPSSLELENTFPTLNDTMEMGRLSKLIYAFKHDTTCNATNAQGEPLLPTDLECHFYEHENFIRGTQVMIFSSSSQKYIALVYAGTDNLRTALTDTDILQKPLGPLNDTNGDSLWLPGPARVHAGFDNAVFENGLFDRVLDALDRLLQTYPYSEYRLFTTGHSLGAADATLAAIGLHQTLLSPNHNGKSNVHNRKFRRRRSLSKDTTTTVKKVTCINFGCPRIGNKYFTMAVNEMEHIGIWRFVLGLDLVPRLPDGVFFDHVGHTIQLDYPSSKYKKKQKKKWYKPSDSNGAGKPGKDNDTATPRTDGALAYYRHHGNETLGYEGVPIGWNSKSFIWVPGAMELHFMRKYLAYFKTLSMTDPKNHYVNSFALIPDDSNNNDTSTDDDFYINPPDDVIFDVEQDY
mmetsp:Transcript_19807/g.28032  ORF Transcript_19807/g.28032 Transcript_19807/m.28032 type:complete len:453 (+) Transcript_19807:44-1402(+)